MTTADVVVLRFGERRVPRRLADLALREVTESGEIDDAAAHAARLIVVGSDADLAAVLTRLLRTDRLGVEVAYVAHRRSPATRAYRLPTGPRSAWRARSGVANRVPLIRDDTGAVVAGSASWAAADGVSTLQGEAIVDDTTLFDGEVAGVRIEPLTSVPGLRAAVLTPRGRPGRWVAGRAAQLGSPGASVTRDGITATRTSLRSTFYRHVEGWLLVR